MAPSISYSTTVAPSQGRPHFRTASKSHPAILDIDSSSNSSSDSPPRRPSVSSTTSSSISSTVAPAHTDKFRSWQFPGSPDPDQSGGLGRIEEEEGSRGVRFTSAMQGDRRTPSPTRPQSHQPTPSMPYPLRPSSPIVKRGSVSGPAGGSVRFSFSRMMSLLLGHMQRARLSDLFFGCVFFGCFCTFMGSLGGVGYVPPVAVLEDSGIQQIMPLPGGNAGMRLAAAHADWDPVIDRIEDDEEDVPLPLKAGVEPLNPKDDGPLFGFLAKPKKVKKPQPPPPEEVVIVRFSEDHPTVVESGEKILEPHDEGKDDLVKGSPEGRWGEAHEGHLHHEEEGNIFAIKDLHAGDHSHDDGVAHGQVIEVGAEGWTAEEERRAVVLGKGEHAEDDSEAVESDFHVYPSVTESEVGVAEPDDEELATSEDIKRRAKQLIDQQAGSWSKPPPEDEADAQLERDYARRIAQSELEADMDSEIETPEIDVDADTDVDADVDVPPTDTGFVAGEEEGEDVEGVEERSGRRGLRIRRF